MKVGRFTPCVLVLHTSLTYAWLMPGVHPAKDGIELGFTFSSGYE
jgi:hypothetical protein